MSGRCFQKTCGTLGLGSTVAPSAQVRAPGRPERGILRALLSSSRKKNGLPPGLRTTVPGTGSDRPHS
eukprot:1936607-Lingulodinium_polyedra.AAC.1